MWKKIRAALLISRLRKHLEGIGLQVLSKQAEDMDIGGYCQWKSIRGYYEYSL